MAERWRKNCPPHEQQQQKQNREPQGWNHSRPGPAGLHSRPWAGTGGGLRRLELKRTYQNSQVSKAQLIAFFTKVDTNPSLKLQVDAATDASAVVAIAQTEGFLFSAASLSRHQRG